MYKLVMTVLFTLVLPVTWAQENGFRTGEFTATASVLGLLGETDARNFADKIPIDRPIAWEVYVPENYDPDTPAGVLVFINSRDSGTIEQGWKAVMERHNLIWVAANESGNKIPIANRVAYAILAPKLINSRYVINPDRIYLSGFSGGGRVASMVATEYHELFRGAIYNSGANFWGEAALSRYQEMVNNRYVLITGTEDFNLEDTRQVHAEYIKAGIRHSKLLVIPGMGHKRPDPASLETAIEYLDSGDTGPDQD